ncbi:MAG: integrase family protein [Paracoccaceae bacterium]
MPKLTETFARNLSHPQTGTAKCWDNEVKGLGLFVGKRAKTWYFQKDVAGQTKRILIGRYPLIRARVARQTALGYALEWSKGAGRRLAFDAPTLGDAMDSYLDRPRLRSQAHRKSLRRLFERHLADWMRLPLDEITKPMVAQRHAALGATPSAANHLLRYFRTVYNHARRTHDLPECPTVAIEWFVEAPAGEIIDDFAFWRGEVAALGNPLHRVFYGLVLFTGLRRTEALSLEWKHVHEDHIHLPMTKNGRSFDLPILPGHHEILAPARGIGRKWVFPSRRARAGHINQPAQITWSPHAHRRTFATVAMEAGVLEEVVGRLLNHTPPTITGRRYVKPSLDALRPAMETVFAELERRVGQGVPGGDRPRGGRR